METPEKVILIRNLASKHGITAYDIGKNTSISLTSARNVLEEENITYRNKTLNIILDYIEKRIVGTESKYELRDEFKQKVAEKDTDYKPKKFYDLKIDDKLNIIFRQQKKINQKLNIITEELFKLNS